MTQPQTIETCSVRGVRLYEMRHVLDPVRLVLASRPDEPEDYIRDYAEFLNTVRQEVSV